MGEKTAKKAGKSGRESRFLPEKKVKISPKYCFSGTLPFLGQKKKTLSRIVPTQTINSARVQGSTYLDEDGAGSRRQVQARHSRSRHSRFSFFSSLFRFFFHLSFLSFLCFLSFFLFFSFFTSFLAFSFLLLYIFSFIKIQNVQDQLGGRLDDFKNKFFVNLIQEFLSKLI